MDYNKIFDLCTQSINDWSINTMQQNGIKFDIASVNAPYLQFLNHRGKLISNKPRVVSYSSTFQINEENREGLNNLVSDIKHGNDINKHLSKLINNAKIPDGMLDHFGCKHFHLGNVLEGAFIKRTGEIALAFVSDDEIFFIEAKTHGGNTSQLIWFEQSVVEILHNERPSLISKYKVEGFKDITPKFTDPNDIKTMRGINVNTYIIIDDTTAYSPMNLGSTLGGLGVELTMKYIHIQKSMSRAIHDFLNNFENDFENVTINNIKVYDLQAIDYGVFNHFKVDIDYTNDNYDKKHTQPFNA